MPGQAQVYTDMSLLHLYNNFQTLFRHCPLVLGHISIESVLFQIKTEVNILIRVWWQLAKLQKIPFKLPLWPHKAANPPETLWAFIKCWLLAFQTPPSFCPDIKLAIQNPYPNQYVIRWFSCLSLWADLEFQSNFLSSCHCQFME